MNIPELKEKIAELKPILEDHAIGRHRFIYSEEARALQTLLSTCQLLCDVSDKMLPKKVVPEIDRDFTGNADDSWDNGNDVGEADGYNLARSEDILWLTKKMMGIEEVIENIIHSKEKFTGIGLTDQLINAIRQEMGGEK